MRLGHGTALNVGPAALGPPAIWHDDNTLVISFEHGRTLFLGTELQRGYAEQRAPAMDPKSFLGEALTAVRSEPSSSPASASFLGTGFSRTLGQPHPGTRTATFLGTSFTDVHYVAHSGATFT